MKKTSATLLAALAVNPAMAARAIDALDDCRAMIEDADRLACYDGIFLLPESSYQRPTASEIDSATDSAASADVTPVFGKPSKRKFRYRLLDESFSIQPHRPTYLLPYTYAANVNAAPFTSVVDNLPDSSDSSQSAEPDREEVKFQISFKIPLATDLLLKDATLWAGYSQVSLWQMYNSDASAPFRETNYEPEIFWQVPTTLELYGISLDSVSLGFNHQSNGRGQGLSRSWNRIFSEVHLSHNRWTMALRPWYRLPESAGDDDNPDIDDYLGHGDLTLAYKWSSDLYLTTQLRQSVHSHTSVNMALVFPLAGPLNGYFEYINGYGETLIDYDHRTRRVGIGVILNEWK